MDISHNSLSELGEGQHKPCIGCKPGVRGGPGWARPT